MFKGVYKGARVLLTGHTGFKGSWLTLWLLELGAEVAGYSLSPPSEPTHFEVLGLERHVRHYPDHDVRDLARLDSVFSDFAPRFVFHLAAQPIVRAAYDDPISTFETNALGVVNVLEAVRRSRSVAVTVVVTSDKCYENLSWDYGYREDDRLGGVDPYSASKACAELAFSSFARSYFASSSGPRIASARAGNVIGGGDWGADRLVPDCMRSWAKGEPPVIRSPEATRPWQHVLEPLSGYLWLAASLAEGRAQVQGESFNFGPPAESDHTVEALIETMQGTWPGPTWIRDHAASTLPKEASVLKLCCDKALRRLGWLPTLSFEETAKATAEWYRTFYSEGRDIAQLSSGQLATYQEAALQRGRAWIA